MWRRVTGFMVDVLSWFARRMNLSAWLPADALPREHDRHHERAREAIGPAEAEDGADAVLPARTRERR
jgi:hypothetical protein